MTKLEKYVTSECKGFSRLELWALLLLVILVTIYLTSGVVSNMVNIETIKIRPPVDGKYTCLQSNSISKREHLRMLGKKI